MLAKELRLTSLYDFEMVKSLGESFSSSHFKLVFLVQSEESLKFGFIVSKKLSKKAVLRNRVKRLMRESVRPLIDKIKGSYSIVLIARTGAEKLSLDEYKSEIVGLFKKAKLI